MSVILVDENAIKWETWLKTADWLTLEEKERMSRLILTEWEGPMDMYAGYLIRQGIEAVKAVPTHGEAKFMLDHKFGFKVVKLPVDDATRDGGLRNGASFVKAIKRNFSPNIIQFNNCFSGYFVMGAVMKDGAAVLGHVSGRKISLKMEPGFRKCDGILLGALSREEQEQALRLKRHKKKLKLCEMIAIDESFFHEIEKEMAQRELGFNPDETNILVVTSMRERHDKDPLMILSLFAMLGRRDWRLHFVGSGPALPTLVGQAERLGIAKHVSFHGLRPHNKLPGYYSACDFSMSSARELDVQYGGSFIESFACRRAVVAIKMRRNLEFEQRGGFLVDDSNADDLERVLELKEALERKAQEGYEISKLHRIEVIGKRLTEIYAEL